MVLEHTYNIVGQPFGVFKCILWLGILWHALENVIYGSEQGDCVSEYMDFAYAIPIYILSYLTVQNVGIKFHMRNQYLKSANKPNRQ